MLSLYLPYHKPALDEVGTGWKASMANAFTLYCPTCKLGEISKLCMYLSITLQQVLVLLGLGLTVGVYHSREKTTENGNKGGPKHMAIKGLSSLLQPRLRRYRREF